MWSYFIFCVPGTENFISGILKFVFIELNQIKSICAYDSSILWFTVLELTLMGKNVTWHLGIETETQVYVTLSESGLFLYPNHSHSFTVSIADLQCERHPGYSWYFEEVKDQLTNSSQVAQVFRYCCPHISHSPTGVVRQWQPTAVLLPGGSHGGRSLVGYSPWGHKELDTTEQFHFHFHFQGMYTEIM